MDTQPQNRWYSSIMIHWNAPRPSFKTQYLKGCGTSFTGASIKIPTDRTVSTVNGSPATEHGPRRYVFSLSSMPFFILTIILLVCHSTRQDPPWHNTLL